MAGTDIREYVRDRRNVAIHEAGHIIAHRMYGGEGYARIRPVNLDDRLIPAGYRRKLWGGIAITPGAHKLSRDMRRIIAVAGAVAEMLETKAPEESSPMELMSKSDSEMIGATRSNCHVLNPAIAFMTHYLSRNRPKLLALARELIVESRSCAPETAATGNLLSLTAVDIQRIKAGQRSKASHEKGRPERRPPIKRETLTARCTACIHHLRQSL